VKRLLLLVGAIVFVDTMLYAALVPLLPHYAHRFDLSKTGAGVLVATYAAGVLLAGLPGGVAAGRYGPKRATMAGLVLMACASVAFALAGSVWTLGIARGLQGFGSGFSWAGGLAWLMAGTPRERRGELLGTALGAAVFGALFGPVLGAIASGIGTAAAFGSVALLVVGLLVRAAGTPGAPREPYSLRALPAAFRERRFAAGLWLMLLAALLFGVLDVLVPLRLAAHGLGAAGIGAIFLSAAALEAALGPLLGRFSDRRGRRLPVQLGLAASVAVSAALAFSGRPLAVVPFTLCAGLAYGSLFTPGLALVSHGAEHVGLGQGVGFGVMNAAWAMGNVLGPALGGALAQSSGDRIPYALAAVVCLLSLVAVSRGARRRTAARLAAQD
jgi:MFS family permease